jgi:hypothetical protein
MSSQEPVKELDPTPLVNAILEKTKAGKLKWDETADEDIFLVSVGGNTTLQVRQRSDRYEGDRYILSLLDENGKLIWEIDEPWVPTKELYALARRVARKVDERVEALMGTLQKL